jgi:hypothetical protein
MHPKSAAAYSLASGTAGMPKFCGSLLGLWMAKDYRRPLIKKKIFEYFIERYKRFNELQKANSAQTEIPGTNASPIIISEAINEEIDLTTECLFDLHAKHSDAMYHYSNNEFAINETIAREILESRIYDYEYRKLKQQHKANVLSNKLNKSNLKLNKTQKIFIWFSLALAILNIWILLQQTIILKRQLQIQEQQDRHNTEKHPEFFFQKDEHR